MERTRFALIPTSWLEHPEVGPDEIAVLVVLAHHSNTAGQCWPSQFRIGSMLGRSRSWVSGVIARLVLLGLVERQRRRSVNGG
jgi:DNA-binding MarR family transcriptional regulator